MDLNEKEITILKKYGGNDNEIELINAVSRRNGWTHDILSHWVSYVVRNTPFMHDKLEIWANNIADALEESEKTNR